MNLKKFCVLLIIILSACAFISCESKVDPLPPLEPTFLTFESESSFTVKPSPNWNGILEYANSLESWKRLDKSYLTPLAATESKDGKYRLYFRGSNNTLISEGDAWALEGDKAKGVACIGNIEDLLDYKTVSRQEHPQMDSWCFYEMFLGCKVLIQAPELQAITLTPYCYTAMFSACYNLKKAPVLVAKTLANSCYERMFENCDNLVEGPILLASFTNFDEACYEKMFSGCTLLNSITCLTPSIRSEQALNWLNKVAENGTFTKAKGSVWTVGISGIPSGWSVIEK